MNSFLLIIVMSGFQGGITTETFPTMEFCRAAQSEIHELLGLTYGVVHDYNVEAKFKIDASTCVDISRDEPQ